ncbi:MAG: squalene/phytoene synthase family protein [Acidobacteria bacterium]|nr:squalene/phytoene synthase family protein [Acidobacteriota bacterium]
MKSVNTSNIHFTPWHLRDRTRGLRHDLAKTIQSNFFYSFLFLPKHKREAIIDVYGFCRAVDDVVDDLVENDSNGGGENEKTSPMRSLPGGGLNSTGSILAGLKSL